jgi:hypothetical protein
MRVIRTELYFEPNYIQRLSDKKQKTASVTFAWIKSQPSSRLRAPDHSTAISPDQVGSVLDHILRQEPPAWQFGQSHLEVLNQSTVNSILNTDFVVEQSPPEWLTLSNILKEGAKGSTVALAVYVALSGDMLLFITLPSALLIVGAAKGMSKWLEQNVPKLMSHALRRYLR